jgi:hypothetical protein
MSLDTIPFPSELTALSSDISGHFDTMTKHAGDCCDFMGTLGTMVTDKVREAAKTAEHAMHSLLKPLADFASSIKDFAAKLQTKFDELKTKAQHYSTEMLATVTGKINLQVLQVQLQQ